MSLISKKSGIHNHLTSPTRRKHSSLHSVTTGEHSAKSDPAKRPSPFGELKVDTSEPAPPPVYKSIFSL
jgi:hypothetical protein